MSERYQRLFTLAENLYAEGAPVLVSKGALLKDTQTGQILAQLKLRNISAKTIKAVTVRIALLDTVGRSLDSLTEYQFLDLSAGRDDFFGEKTPIYLDNGSARSFSVSVKEVIFEDNSIWNGKENAKWETLPEAKERFKFTADHELEKQFVLHYGADWQFNAKEIGDLWYCVCGAINRAEETECHSCGRSFDQCESFDVKALKAERDDRVEKERANAEFERLTVEKAKKKKRTRSLIALSSIAAVIVLIVLTVNLFIPLGKYSAAKKLYEAGQYDEAIAAFEALEGYKDSGEKIKECQYGIKYDSAAKLYEDGKYQEAIAAFEEIKGFKDSNEQIEKCKTILYDAAVKLYESGQYKEAIAAFEKIKGFKDSSEQIIKCQTAVKEAKYKTAVSLIEKGDYINAYETLSELDGYKDSAEKAEGILPRYKVAKIKTTPVGGTVSFGSYEQDNNTSNGKEDIEWFILAKEGNKALMLSKYALDSQPYNTSNNMYRGTDATWETCSLRKWLNGTFFSSAFSSEEQNSIISSTVTADNNPSYSISPGNNTTDKVFLLSITEIEKYFSSDDDRKCEHTDYAKEQAETVYNMEGDVVDNCWWWLRSPGISKTYAAFVDERGDVQHPGSGGQFEEYIRPAIWIDLEA